VEYSMGACVAHKSALCIRKVKLNRRSLNQVSPESRILRLFVSSAQSLCDHCSGADREKWRAGHS
jgi:hypothetical protein